MNVPHSQTWNIKILYSSGLKEKMFSASQWHNEVCSGFELWSCVHPQAFTFTHKGSRRTFISSHNMPIMESGAVITLSSSSSVWRGNSWQLLLYLFCTTVRTQLKWLGCVNPSSYRPISKLPFLSKLLHTQSPPFDFPEFNFPGYSAFMNRSWSCFQNNAQRRHCLYTVNVGSDIPMATSKLC